MLSERSEATSQACRKLSLGIKRILIFQQRRLIQCLCLSYLFIMHGSSVEHRVLEAWFHHAFSRALFCVLAGALLCKLSVIRACTCICGKILSIDTVLPLENICRLIFFASCSSKSKWNMPLHVYCVTVVSSGNWCPFLFFLMSDCWD